MKNTKNNVLLISPYLDVLGGGEQHIFSILKLFDAKGYSCDVVWKDETILERLEKTHNISFSNTKIIPIIPSTNEYEYCIYVTDGSYFFSKSKHTYIFYMYPERKIMPLSIVNKLKTRGSHLFANGQFTAEKMKKMLGKGVEVIHPYIDDVFFSSKAKKKKMILSVGRFFPHLHSKRQDVLIEAFIKLQEVNKKFRDYSLILAGGLKDTKEDKAFYEKLMKMKAGNKNIEIKTNIDQKELLELFHSASIYWHAAGYGIDEDKNPDAVEHLGITPLEGMAAGAVTMCHNSGGPRRYIKNNENGFLYDTIDELVATTIDVSDEMAQIISERGRDYVRTHFSKEVFEKKVKDYFHL